MPEWLLQTLVVAGLIGLAASIWRAHEKRDEERFNDVWNQIGRDSNSGMRKKVHDTPSLALKLDDLKERVERLEDER